MTTLILSFFGPKNCALSYQSVSVIVWKFQSNMCLERIWKESAGMKCLLETFINHIFNFFLWAVNSETTRIRLWKKEVGFEFEVIGPTYVCPSLLKFAKLFLNCLLLLCVHPCLTNCGLQLQIYHCPAYIWRLYSARPYYPLTSSEIRGATWQLKFSPFVFTICHLWLFNGCTRMRLHAL